MVAGGRDETPIQDQWSCGGRTSIPKRTYALLLRQNKQRGIVASGYTVGEVFSAPHWEDATKSANYISVIWTTVLPYAEQLPTSDLIRRFPKLPWNRLYASGVMPNTQHFEFGESTDDLIQYWEDFIGIR
jgi:hypothetical protein